MSRKDSFSVTVARDLGEILAVQIRHEDTGDSPNWSLEKVTVLFICLSICLSLSRLFVCPSLALCVSISVCLSICLSTQLSKIIKLQKSFIKN